MSGATHAVCAREAGPATLESLARTLADGDGLLMLGPEHSARAIVGHGLRAAVDLRRVGSVGGGFRPVAHLVRQAAAGASTVQCHGPQAFAIVSGAGCHAVRARELTIEPAKVAPWSAERRARVRAELGLRGDVRGVLLAGDPSEAIDARFAVRVGGMARFAGTRLRFIASPALIGVDKAMHWLERLGIGDAMALHPLADEPWRILGALDAAFIDRAGGQSGDSDALVDRALLPIGTLASDWRGPAPAWGPSALVAAWSIAAGVRTFVHESIDVTDFVGTGPVHRFGDDVAQGAELLGSALAASPMRAACAERSA